MIYLDNAATSWPKPAIVKKAAYRAMSMCSNPGRSSHEPALMGANVLLECRSRLCEYFNTDDESRYIFTLNCTDSLNMAIKGMLVNGDHVVTTALEHNSVLRPLHSLSKNNNISYSVVLPRSDGKVHPMDIMGAQAVNTKLVVITHASNVTGDVQPIKEIIRLCHNKGIYVLVDGAQTAGKIHIDLNDLDPDLYAFPAHKGLLGTMGCGVLYVSKNIHPQCIREGGTGSASMSLDQPLDMPDHLESGTPSVDSIAALAAGIYLCSHNKEIYHKHCNRLTSMLKDGLKDIKDIKIYSHDIITGIVTFNIGDIPSYILGDYLTANDIAARSGYHCAPLCHRYLNTYEIGALRLSLGPFNTAKDIETTIRIVHRFSKMI